MDGTIGLPHSTLSPFFSNYATHQARSDKYQFLSHWFDSTRVLDQGSKNPCHSNLVTYQNVRSALNSYRPSHLGLKGDSYKMTFKYYAALRKKVDVV